MTLEKFHAALGKFLVEVKKKDKSPYNDGYKDAIVYVLEWIEEYL